MHGCAHASEVAQQASTLMLINLRVRGACHGALRIRKRTNIMKIGLPALAIALLAISVPGFAQHPDAANAQTVNAAAQFQADVPLSREMAAIQSTFATELPAIRTGRVDAPGMRPSVQRSRLMSPQSSASVTFPRMHTVCQLCRAMRAHRQRSLSEEPRPRDNRIPSRIAGLAPVDRSR